MIYILMVYGSHLKKGTMSDQKEKPQENHPTCALCLKPIKHKNKCKLKIVWPLIHDDGSDRYHNPCLQAIAGGKKRIMYLEEQFLCLGSSTHSSQTSSLLHTWTSLLYFLTNLISFTNAIDKLYSPFFFFFPFL